MLGAYGTETVPEHVGCCQMSREKKKLMTVHYTGCLRGILTMDFL